MQSKDIRRSLGEVLILVMGILLAFGVDSGWQSVQDRRAAAEVVQSITQAFEANRDQLDIWVERRARKMAATHELLLVVTDSSSPIPPDSVAALIATMRQGQSFIADDSRLSELLASGRMHLIEGAELRSRLAGWGAQLADVREIEASATMHTRQAIDPWLRARLPVAGVQGRFDQVPPRSLEASDVQTLRNVEFENLLRDMFFFDRRAEEREAGIRDLINEILRLLAQE